mgnify:FL=1
MTSKEWILLIIPIVCTGIMLIVFQQGIVRNTKKYERRNDYGDRIMTEFLESLQSLYILWNDLELFIYPDRAAEEYSFAELWTPIEEHLQKMELFAETHPMTVKSSKLGFTECLESYQNVADSLYRDTMNNNAVISASTFKCIKKEFKFMNKQIRICMENCERYLLRQ